jgi:glycosyltransferase involved in cell wall biosynthesis
MTISVCISAYNSEKKIRSTLESVGWADEIIVVDGPSGDSTEKIAREYTGNVFKFPYEANLSVKKNFSFKMASSDWVLYLDTDEVVSEGLRDEILGILNAAHSHYDAYYVPRKNHFLGKWIRYCGWYPDHTLRLFRKGKALFPCEHIHETVKVAGSVGYLKNDVLHHPHSSIDEYIEKMNFFTASEAQYAAKLRGKKRKWRLKDFLFDPQQRKPVLRTLWTRYVPLKPFIRFFLMYFLRSGFRDGREGFLVCVLSAFYDFVQEAKTKEILLKG